MNGATVTVELHDTGMVRVFKVYEIDVYENVDLGALGRAAAERRRLES